MKPKIIQHDWYFSMMGIRGKVMIVRPLTKREADVFIREDRRALLLAKKKRIGLSIDG